MKTRVQQAVDVLMAINAASTAEVQTVCDQVVGNDLCFFFKEHVLATARLAAKQGLPMVGPETFMVLGYMIAKLEKNQEKPVKLTGDRTLVA